LQFITASTYRRAPLFLSERFSGGFVETLAQARPEMTCLLIGWVLRPDNFHLLLSLCDNRIQRVVAALSERRSR
jgi:REP element-mobilizing transposase RayT